MTTDRDIADKRNEVTMLRLQIAEHKAHRRLDEIEQSELNDAVFAANRRQEDTIDTYKDAVASQNKVLKDFQDEINEKDTTIKEMKSKVEPPNLAVMVLLHNLNAKTEALEADLKASHTNNAALGKALEEANTTLYNAKNVVEGLEAELRDEMQQKYVAIRLGAEKAATVLRLNETISDLRMAASDMLDTINECARGEADDSRVLMKVVKAVDTWHRCMIPTSLSGCTDLIKVLDDVLEDYSNTPEGPVVTLKTPSMGTRVVSKNEETHVIDAAKMRAVQALIGCGDKWVLHIDVDAVEVAKYNQTIDEMQSTIRALKAEVSVRDGILIGRQSTIDELKNFIREQGGCVDDRDNRIEQLIALNEALRVDIELTHNLSRDHIAGQDRFIEELRKDLDARNKTITDFKAIEQKETGRLHTIIEEFKSAHRVYRKCLGDCRVERNQLNHWFCEEHNKLARIKKIAEHPACDCFSTALDEITKIIQEE